MRKLSFLLLAIVVALLWVGCGSSSSGYDSATTESYEYAMEEAPEISEMPSNATADVVGEGSSDADADGRMIIKTAFLGMLTEEFDASLANITDEVEKHGGEISDSSLWRNGSEADEHRVIELTIRVPSENYNELLSGVQNAATITSMNESSEDVTTEYIDLTARVEALEAQEERLVELIEQAENVTEIMEIEYQLSNVRYERESYEQQRLYLERQVSMSTINLTLTESRTIVITQQGFFADVANSFLQGVDFLIELLSSFVTIFATLLPTLVFAGVILVIVLAIYKATEPKRMEKQRIREEKRREMAARMPIPYPPQQPQPNPMQPPVPPQMTGIKKQNKPSKDQNENK